MTLREKQMIKTIIRCYIFRQRYSIIPIARRTIRDILRRPTLIARNASVVFYGERLSLVLTVNNIDAISLSIFPSFKFKKRLDWKYAKAIKFYLKMAIVGKIVPPSFY